MVKKQTLQDTDIIVHTYTFLNAAHYQGGTVSKVNCTFVYLPMSSNFIISKYKNL